jgi:hypothetical protein
MLATLQQQWASRYLRLTQLPRSSLHERARIHEFFANGIHNLRLSLLVESLPTMIHISLFLFFAGLLVYLFNANHTVFTAVAVYVSLSAITYLSITFLPLLQPESAYYTPLSSITGLFKAMERMAKETVQRRSAEIDDRILHRLFTTLSDNSDEVRFFESIPGFCRSSVVEDPIGRITKLGFKKLDMALKGFLERTWSSNLLSDEDRMRRLAVCAKVADAVGLPGVSTATLNYIFPWDSYQVLRTVEMGQSLRSRGNTDQEVFGLCARSIVAGIISEVQGSDDHWIALAADQLDKPESAIRAYLEDGNDNVLLANLIHIARQIFDFSLGDNLSREMAYASTFVLRSLTHFDIRSTLPELQDDFRAFWDEIVEASDNEVVMEIRDCLLNLHEDLIPGTGCAMIALSPSDIPFPGKSSYSKAVDDHATLSFHHDASLPIDPPSHLLVPGHSTVHSADKSSPAYPPNAPITPVSFVSDLSGDPQDVASPATATPGNTADTSSRDLPTLRPHPGSAPPVDVHSPTDAAMVPSVYILHDDTLGSSSPASISVASPAPPPLAYSLDPDDPVHMESPHHSPQSYPSDDPA